jgi:site-specific recombinase XerD
MEQAPDTSMKLWPSVLTHDQLARVLDVTTARVKDWAARGVVVPIECGRFHRDEAALGALILALLGALGERSPVVFEVVRKARSRQSTLSSLCAWLVKRESLTENPVAKLDRPRYERTPPKQVPGAELMDALLTAAKRRKRPRDIAIFLILRYTGMRRESVASLRIRHLDSDWGLRGVYTKGGKTRDIPLPSVVMKFLQTCVERALAPEVGQITADTPLFWSRWPGRRGVRRLEPIQGKNIWRLCKTYGRLIGVPELRPHDLRHGVAMEVLEQHHDLEQVRALLGHTQIDTTQIYATIRPAQLKRAVAFYEDKAARMLSG